MIPKKQDLLNKNPNFLEEVEALDELEFKNSETPSLEESVEKAKEVIASLEEPDKALQKFVELKASFNQLKTELETAEIEALDEALAILQYNQKHGGNNTVYSDTTVRVSISFRQRYATAKDSPELARLEDEIRAEEIRLLQYHQEKLTRLDNQIEELETQIRAIEERKQKLMESKRLSSLQATYQKVIQESAYTVPGLVVHFKKSR